MGMGMGVLCRPERGLGWGWAQVEAAVGCEAVCDQLFSKSPARSELRLVIPARHNRHGRIESGHSRGRAGRGCTGGGDMTLDLTSTMP